MTCTEHQKKEGTSSSVTQVRLHKTFLVLGGFNTSEHEPEEKEERMPLTDKPLTFSYFLQINYAFQLRFLDHIVA